MGRRKAWLKFLMTSSPSEDFTALETEEKERV
jgi:hypothetical protein